MDLYSDQPAAFHAAGKYQRPESIGRHRGASPVDDRSARSRDRLCLHARPGRRANGRLTQPATRIEEVRAGAFFPQHTDLHRTAAAAGES
jgi:hypothetical protein